LAFIAGSAAGARGEDAELRDLVQGAIELYNEHARDPLPRFTSEQFEDLLDHEVVKVRRKEARAGDPTGQRHHRVVGFILVDQPRVNVWIAVMDSDLWSESRYHGVRIWSDDRGRATMYQHVDLPWPLADRHWVIDLDKGWDVTAASDGLIWEHLWELAPEGERVARDVVGEGKVPGLTLEDIEDAVYLPSNHGAWIVISLAPQRSLLVYHVSADMGGSIPESWVATAAMAHLESLLGRAAEISALVPDHYQGDHAPILSGTGEPIATFSPARK
jgi:hypothetical protein